MALAIVPETVKKQIKKKMIFCIASGVLVSEIGIYKFAFTVAFARCCLLKISIGNFFSDVVSQNLICCCMLLYLANDNTNLNKKRLQ